MTADSLHNTDTSRLPVTELEIARLIFDHNMLSTWGPGRPWWAIDWPEAEQHFTDGVRRYTNINIAPDSRHIRLTDKALYDFPWLLVQQPGRWNLDIEEQEHLREYLLRGGFMMVDDFWGDSQYENMRLELKRVFPDRNPFEVPLEHEIFHNVYDMKEKPQVPAINAARHFANGQVGSFEFSRDGSDTSTPHYKAITDDKDRIMVFICHNTDLGDGWEREGENQWYFEEFSVKKAYPMGINIVTYAMTH